MIYFLSFIVVVVAVDPSVSVHAVLDLAGFFRHSLTPAHVLLSTPPSPFTHCVPHGQGVSCDAALGDGVIGFRVGLLVGWLQPSGNGPPFAVGDPLDGVQALLEVPAGNPILVRASCCLARRQTSVHDRVRCVEAKMLGHFAAGTQKHRINA